jgi:hypothetical protein
MLRANRLTLPFLMQSNAPQLQPLSNIMTPLGENLRRQHIIEFPILVVGLRPAADTNGHGEPRNRGSAMDVGQKIH